MVCTQMPRHRAAYFLSMSLRLALHLISEKVFHTLDKAGVKLIPRVILIKIWALIKNIKHKKVALKNLDCVSPNDIYLFT